MSMSILYRTLDVISKEFFFCYSNLSVYPKIDLFFFVFMCEDGVILMNSYVENPVHLCSFRSHWYSRAGTYRQPASNNGEILRDNVVYSHIN